MLPRSCSRTVSNFAVVALQASPGVLCVFQEPVFRPTSDTSRMTSSFNILNAPSEHLLGEVLEFDVEYSGPLSPFDWIGIYPMYVAIFAHLDVDLPLLVPLVPFLLCLACHMDDGSIFPHFMKRQLWKMGSPRSHMQRRLSK